ncbi:MAG: hypothetical protein WCJ64_09960 [Rhodospirillaceae bacterium]
MAQTFAAVSLTGEDRVWIDAGGGIHVLDRTHGGAFQEVHRLACGRAVSPEAWAWMRSRCGSEPDRDDGMNPGWQFVEYAKHVLGWARVTVNVWVCSTEIALEFDDDALTESAARSMVALMRFVEKNAPKPVIVTDDFGHTGQEIGQTLREYRLLLNPARHGEHRSQSALAEAPATVWPAAMPTRH